jgi:hypothetical protein
MKRIVVFLTVWAMALAGVLTSVMILPSAASAAVPTAAGVYASVTPSRLLDTSIGLGASKAAVAANGTVHLQVTGRGGVAASGVSAVALNVTVTAPGKGGFVSVYAEGATPSVTPSLNFVKGQTVTNLVIAPVGTNGMVALRNSSTGTIQLVADVSGYYLAGTPLLAGAFGSLASSPLLDTSIGLGAPKAAVAANGTVHLQATGRGGVPAGVSAVVLNVTVTAPAKAGFLSVYAEGATPPGTSSLSFTKGQTVTSLVIAPVGTNGMVALRNSSTGTIQLVADVSGYYLAGTPVVAGAFGSLASSPLLDTRIGLGAPKAAVAANGTVHLQVTGRGGVPAGVSAVVLNVTVTAPAKAGFVGVYAEGALPPATSSLNFTKGQTVTSLVIAPVGTNGMVALRNASTGTIQLVADVSGYVLDPSPDLTAPGPVTALTATAASTTAISLAWVNPAATDFTGVTVRRALGAAAPATVTDGTAVAVPASTTATSFTDTGLVAGTQYSYAVFAHDAALNSSVAANVTATTLAPPDVTAPGSVTGLAATVAGDTSVRLDWTNPADADFTGVTIRRALGATAPATATSGTSVTGGVATATSYIDTGLSVGQQYSYAVFAHDGSGNLAAAAKVTATTTTSSRPTAVLSVNSSHGLTAKTSVGGYTALFDASASLAGSGATLVTAVLDYGDGTALVPFSGDPATWFTVHNYATVGDKTVTVVVTNSAGATATDSVRVTVYPMPTATIRVLGPVVLGQPVTFELTSLTPAGTVFTDYDFCYDGTTGAIWDRQSGVPPTTTTHTFTAEGTYDAEFYAYNDADGWAFATVVVTVDATPPGPVTTLTAAAGADSMALAWANPGDADFAGVTIRRLPGATAPTLTTGTLVTDTARAATSYSDTGLALGQQYSYAVFAHDGSGNFAAAANVTGTTIAVRPIAVLSVNGSTAATAKASVGGYTPLFDLSGSQAGAGTLVSALLDFGDGTTQTFTGADPTAWFSLHAYTTSGDKAVTVLVTDSAGGTATAAVLVTVFGAPTAMITPPRIARPAEPLTLALTSSTPAGTAFTDYDVSYDNGASWVYVSGVPPTTLTHTFGAEGTYTVLFDVYNDADGWARSSAQVRVDVTPPAPVTGLVVSVVSVGDNFLSLSWVNPADADYTGVMIRRQVGAIAPATINDGDLVMNLVDLVPYVVNPGLTPGTQYSYAVFAVDGSGNYAAGVSATGTTTGTPPHLVPPGPVTTLSAVVVSDTSIALSWANPTDADFAGVTIRRAEGPTAPASVSAGVAVTVPVSATATSFTDTGLTAGTQYSYAVFSYDAADNHAAGVNVTRTTTRSTTAVLLVDTTRITTGSEFFCDPSPSYAATGATSLSGTLDYGDGSPLETFSGDPVGWFAFHTYATPGAKTMTWTVKDSANKSVTTLVTMSVFDPPTAEIPSVGQAQVGVPYTFPLTATTPVGTSFQGWSLYGDWLAGGYGTVVPATLTHTFTEPGTYFFTLTVTNDAHGEVTSAPMAVTVVR